MRVSSAFLQHFSPVDPENHLQAIFKRSTGWCIPSPFKHLQKRNYLLITGVWDMPSIHSLTLHPLYSVSQSPESCRWWLCANIGSSPATSHRVEHWGHKFIWTHQGTAKAQGSKGTSLFLQAVARKEENELLGRARNLSVTSWFCQVVASTPMKWHFEERSTGSLMATTGELIHLSAAALTTEPAVTCELPCQCANAGRLNGQKKSSKHLTSQPRVRFLSIELPAGAGGPWKRMCKHSVQTAFFKIPDLSWSGLLCFSW